MDYVELFVLVAFYSQDVETVAVAPTLATCQIQQAELLKQALPAKPGTACLKHRQYYVADFEFKAIP